MVDIITGFCVRMKNDKRAVTALEYALIAGLIAVVIVGAVTTLGGNISSTFSTIASDVG